MGQSPIPGSVTRLHSTRCHPRVSAVSRLCSASSRSDSRRAVGLVEIVDPHRIVIVQLRQLRFVAAGRFGDELVVRPFEVAKLRFLLPAQFRGGRGVDGVRYSSIPHGAGPWSRQSAPRPPRQPSRRSPWRSDRLPRSSAPATRRPLPTAGGRGRTTASRSRTPARLPPRPPRGPPAPPASATPGPTPRPWPATETGPSPPAAGPRTFVVKPGCEVPRAGSATPRCSPKSAPGSRRWRSPSPPAAGSRATVAAGEVPRRPRRGSRGASPVRPQFPPPSP